jgi:UDP-galactopyranose mutase
MPAASGRNWNPKPADRLFEQGAVPGPLDLASEDIFMKPSLVPVGAPPGCAPVAKSARKPLLLALSHLRWNFVFQRPQHLLTRAAADYRVVYVEEPEEQEGVMPGWALTRCDGVTVAVPLLPPGLAHNTRTFLLEALLDRLLAGERPAVGWFYTPMALEFARHVAADVTVYDNMDELSLFRGADARLLLLETELMARADVVFTGGHSLYEAKRHRHRNIHPVPSSVDVAHFREGVAGCGPTPADQAAIPAPRVGFFGVIDERMDMALLAGLADARPDLEFVMLGPVVKIDPASRPVRRNLHWLGAKAYGELPPYLAGWACGIMPFARNEATRFISPTKTPEFLAAGLPVVSTPIRDVVRPWGEPGLVEIADDVPGFAAAIDRAVAKARTHAWRRDVATALARTSWDRTWATMHAEIAALLPAEGVLSDA